MAITLPAGGQWALSRIVNEGNRAWTTDAHLTRLAPTVEGYYPPILHATGSYALPVALVRLVGAVGTPGADTWLLPPLGLDASIGDLTLQDRQALRALLNGRLSAYDYLDWDAAPRSKLGFDFDGYTTATALRTVVLDVFTHLAHSDARPRPSAPEPHNTEYTDNFTTDPSSRWTGVSGGTYTWDSTDFEMDCDLSVSRAAMRYNSEPGSVEHEAQATHLVSDLGASYDTAGGGSVRIDNGSADDFYFAVSERSTDSVLLYRHTAGVRTALATWTGRNVSSLDFITMRVAASGAVGANVVIDHWFLNHGATKPADPGWIGVDGTPDDTYTDTSADRLDASTHACGGIGWHGQGGDWDTRHDYFKVRAISDRGGTPPAASATVYARRRR